MISPASLEKYQILIGGKWLDPHGGAWFESDDPYQARPWALIPRSDASDVDLAVKAAHAAFISGKWPSLHPTARGTLLRRLGDVIGEAVDALALIESRDNGKRLAEARAQLQYLPEYFYYYAGLADKIEGTVVPIDRADIFNYTLNEPYGVVAAIMPWNSPLMIAAWKIAPALAAGNTLVLKPSEHASASTLEFCRLFEKAGFPAGVVNVVTGFGSEVGEALIRHPNVSRITFTGSGAVGRRIAELAGRDVKRVTLELGGKSPQIVFGDADLTDSIHGVVSGIFMSNGQSCIAGSRLLLHESIHNEFLQRLTAAVRGVRLGDPADATTHVGPIANRPQYEKILKYMAIAREEGAKCILGGGPARQNEGAGWFIEPTIFTGVTNSMQIAREEIFGPVLCVMTFRDDEEAVCIANDTAYGLAAGVWTQDMRRVFALAKRLAAGTVYVNQYRLVSALSPVGGYKQSGYGHENGIAAIREFLRIKSVWLGLGPLPNPLS